MEFNRLVIEKLDLMFVKEGFVLDEQSKDVIKYGSEKLIISLAHNVRENSNILWVGRKHLDNFIEIDDYIMDNFFHSNLKINNLLQGVFVENVFLFFSEEGESLLKGDEQEIRKIEIFDNIRSEEYTSRLVDDQNIGMAMEAWKDKKYADVIKYLDKISNNTLSKSLKMKYEISQKKLGSLK
jgi:hypothetical protein